MTCTGGEHIFSPGEGQEVLLDGEWMEDVAISYRCRRPGTAR